MPNYELSATYSAADDEAASRAAALIKALLSHLDCEVQDLTVEPEGGDD